MLPLLFRAEHGPPTDGKRAVDADEKKYVTLAMHVERAEKGQSCNLWEISI